MAGVYYQKSGTQRCHLESGSFFDLQPVNRFQEWFYIFLSRFMKDNSADGNMAKGR